jgi:NitT/TauT family transport system substrate-binding protein
VTLARAAWLRSIVALPIAGDALLRAPASAQTVPVRIGAANNEANAYVFFASDMGFFEKNGLTAEISILQNGAAIGAAVAGGSLDIGTSSPFVFMNARRHGLPYTIIAPGALYQSATASSLLVVPANSPIRTAKDLNGKVVGGITVGAMDQLAIWAWLDRNGGDSTTVKVVEVPPSSMVAAMEEGRLAAALIPDPQLTAAGNRIRSLGKAYDAIAPTMMISIWFATIDWATKNPASVQKFHDAMAQTAVWAQANPDKAAVILEKWTKIKVPRIHTFNGTRLDAALIQPIYDDAWKYKMIDAPVDAKTYFWKP